MQAPCYWTSRFAPPSWKKFHLLHNSKSTAKICASCSQLSDDLIPQLGRVPKIASIYYVIFIEEVPSENWPQKKFKTISNVMIS
jgi:hypothetical protein